MVSRRLRESGSLDNDTILVFSRSIKGQEVEHALQIITQSGG